MDVFYVNLDSAVDRREQLEKNFQQMKKDGWTLNRFPAFDSNYVKNNNVAGKLSAPAKACALSHMQIIKENREATKPFVITEDDIVFGPKSCSLIEGFLKLVDQQEWDILYLDIIVPDAEQMLKLAQLRLKQQNTNSMNLLDLKDMNFAGALAYIINPKSLKRLDVFFNAQKTMTTPIDLIYRNLVRQKQLKAFVTFPFLVGSSDASLNSSIQENIDTATEVPTLDTIWCLFRKLIWHGRDIKTVTDQIDQVDAKLNTDESRLYGQLLAARLSSELKAK